MLNRIIQFSVRNKLAIGLFILVWVGYGIYQLTKLPIDAVPDITNNQVQVITTAPSLGAEDVERLITFPVELAVSNVPEIKESRSMSRFGLSLITIVFEDGTDIYWARQQVTERLAQIEINENASAPTLAPVTTGLGEIYQYVLKPQKGYEQTYSLADLRTIQDWTVRRQLLGTPGVADVATFGGELKQYEVAVNPSKLKALNISISDVFAALENNNQNTGGAYIEKGPAVLYIRSVGLTKSIADINKIVVKDNGGVPILIHHVAEVRLGSAIRYGALTMAGQGEVCGGIVMMLKGGNSSDVIKIVKDKVDQIQKTLPKGVLIEPFLDRTKMVNNAIGTVEHNLLEGALIVILVLVLFLGNLRAGLIVASVIPLSLLFAISMMNTFGVSGNLMSLGALDFGLIVDGAVIIVEAILHHIHFSKKYKGIDSLSQQEMDQEVTSSASRMMNAAVFGQIIILIVYLPILSLTGIEGKMFKPMAQTVAFAILGAFILSLTYVPMISSLVVSKKLNHKPNISDRIMTRLERGYQNALTGALAIRKILVAITIALFAISIAVFSKMGGEFIPQLEEGDFAVETRLLVGTNLSTTINAIDRVSEALKNRYPEVEKIVSRIGSAEIPTDPMPIEGGDMIIVLKPKSEWKNAKSFVELAGKMSATAQEVMPGITTGFQFPVQMRFNELMTGAKQDVVCKIYGEDLDKLANYAQQLGDIAKTVKGTADWYIESVTGMPQIVIDYNRDEIAKYGLDIASINRTVNSAFAGASAGKIYEGEKSFDLVVRVGNEGRRNIEDVRNLQVTTAKGIQIPLSQIAHIDEVEGPNQIQRENARRRIIVGFNVRGRDVQSIVEELQHKVAAQLKMDTGYTLTYGGTFENLQQAKARLSIAVPIALLLIFGMLYFAFSSLKDGALIYTAIPLSAIGGVFALALRGMPFSISAGIGFIALFGVAVLNGIVLISEFNRIKKEGIITDMQELIMMGTRNRLRPVLMTAAVASLGFLPMALSNGAGAEVQRPLATVVIGGLISATFLTLFVLPALYLLFNKSDKAFSKPNSAVSKIVLLVLLSCAFFQGAQISAQTINSTQHISLAQAIQRAEHNSPRIQQLRINEQAKEKLAKTGFDPSKLAISGDYGHVNSAYTDNRIGISQTVSFPAVYKKQTAVLQNELSLARESTKFNLLEIRTAVKSLYFDYLAMGKRKELLLRADSLYRIFEAKTSKRFEVGAANILEQTAAQTQRQEINNQLKLLQKDMNITLNRFNFLLQDSIRYIPASDTIKYQEVISIHPDLSSQAEALPAYKIAQLQTQTAHAQWQLERSKLLPEITIGYNSQTLQGVQTFRGQEVLYRSSDRLSYFSAGISVPLFFGAQSNRINAAKLAWKGQLKELEYVKSELKTESNNAIEQVEKFKEVLKYYEDRGLKHADTIFVTADKQFVNGEIDYLQWVILVNQAIGIQSEYINTLNSYNQAAIQLSKLYNE
ncbi:CusA/CzcA family heavy metal efflux RND transporter [Sphingobacterium multivorum]|uniref:CusA/CzcA family heavy metal efflux RND transporter n=1 Tax=Sphingobacterium multivorum TaxID=28454 RepID=A0ABX7CZY4_SPHMU|nr:CusA/CzcA family heavy metal efflux RND transporter [Sphingobacterium multivorum]QQT33137.1 CusA/CzcA family heavy metal efflux RND transporter [Sphingobacterium multivorum]QQT55927.1 CusA/CzcA family heavy metal efflux RND transporter [Sphingobacterium multivorum]